MGAVICNMCCVAWKVHFPSKTEFTNYPGSSSVRIYIFVNVCGTCEQLWDKTETNASVVFQTARGLLLKEGKSVIYIYNTTTTPPWGMAPLEARGKCGVPLDRA